MATEIRNNRELSRYELSIDEELIGIAEYNVVGEVVVFPHTVIDRSRRGQGLGAQLVQFALDDVRATNRTVDPKCWYVAQFIAEHAEYADLAPVVIRPGSRRGPQEAGRPAVPPCRPR